MFQFFKVDVDNHIAVVTIDRAPANAFSYDVYRDLIDVVDFVEKSDTIKVVILTAAPTSKAWVGGADVRDFVGIDYETRKTRYEVVNSSVERLYNLDRPVIAAITGPVVGVGTSIAAYCDIRVASSKAFFLKPEIDRGLVAAGGIQLTRLNIPVGKVREMIYTARRFPVEELRATGFIDYIVDPDQVVSKAMEIARLIATKSLPALKANKICNNAVEGMPWKEGYKLSQEYSAKLTAGEDTQEGIRAFLEHRAANYKN